jgi:DNA-directed RNA polymerase specialized sigma24 family protein
VSPQHRFGDLVSSYAGAMRRLCAVYARDQQDREDLFQTIFLAISRLRHILAELTVN